MNCNKEVALVGVPLDLGANLRGACLGPDAYRACGIVERIRELGFAVKDAGDLDVGRWHEYDVRIRDNKFLQPIAETCENLCIKVEQLMEVSALPIMLGGDHSIAIGSISGASAFFAKRQQKLGLIWIDAHGDLNTPTTSSSGNIHGMPLAVVLGQGFPALVDIGLKKRKVAPENVSLIAIRTLDEAEKKIIRDSGIRFFTMKEIDQKGMHAVMTEAIERAASGTAGVHVSFDLDGIDPSFAPGVSTAVPGGLNFREAHLALEMVAQSGMLCSADIVELNVLKDIEHKTVGLAIDLTLSLLGKSIV